jgi:hypothetical protein
LDRRKFLGIAGLAVASSLAAPALATAAAGVQTADPSNSPERKASGDQPNLPVPDNAIATVLQTKVICREPGRFYGPGTEYALNINGHLIVRKRVMEPGRYLGWPTIAQLPNGVLMVAFSGDRDGHVCPWGKTQVIRSADQGVTWSPPETITNSPLDDRDAGLIVTQKGTLLVSWFTSVAFERPAYEGAYNRYARVGEKISSETRREWLGNWVRRSEDGGKTWLPGVRTVASAPHGPIQLRDGRLLYLGTAVLDGQHTLVAEESQDDGKSWKVLTTIPKPSGSDAGIGEPHLVELASGKILAMFRHEPKGDTSQCFLLQSESSDCGKTWAPLVRTRIWGYPPHLLQLQNGWLLVVYGHRREPYGERACISRDEGKTWDVENEIVLTGAATRDLGYPSSIQLRDGSILTVFYQAEQLGDPAVLMSTHWRLK